MTKKIVCTCPICGEIQQVEVDDDAYEKWKAGACIQDTALGLLSEDEREALISGICPECWDDAMQEEEG